MPAAMARRPFPDRCRERDDGNHLQAQSYLLSSDRAGSVEAIHDGHHAVHQHQVGPVDLAQGAADLLRRHLRARPVTLIRQHGTGDQGIPSLSSTSRIRAGASAAPDITPSAGRSRAGSVAGSNRARNSNTSRSRFALERDVAAKQLGNLVRDRQAEPGAFATTLESRRHLLERREHELLVFLSDPEAGVPDLEVKLARLFAVARGEVDPALVGELDRVAEQVVKHLAQACRIATHPGAQLELAVEREGQSLFGGSQSVDVGHALDFGRQVKRNLLNAHLTATRPARRR